MPELPEVQTTVNGLKSSIVGLVISDIWSNYNSDYFQGSETIKDPAYFKHFKKRAIGNKIIFVERRAKNILISLDGGQTILVHMKMTGHILLGKYEFVPKNKKDPWKPLEPDSLKDPYNRHIRLVFTLSNGCHIALSDVRRFAKVTLIPTDTAHESGHLSDIGPEPLEDSFTLKKFTEQISLRPSRKIKPVLTDQSLIAGIGNIYADESLWRAGIHPATIVSHLSREQIKSLYKAIRSCLSRGISLGGDSMSDYRNVNGEKGAFQEQHHAYRKTGKRCEKKGCKGTIERIVLAGRSTHFCDAHQKLSRKRVTF